MITIGQRLQSAIDHMDKGEYELGLSDICIALDNTAKRHFHKSDSDRTAYKEFLKENMWLILVTCLDACLSPQVKLPFQHDKIKSSQDGYSTLEDIVYHAIRCELIHDTGEKSKIVWNDYVSLAINDQGYLLLSPPFIWGLALAIITCESNKDERVDAGSWIQTMGYKYLINDLWGKKESIVQMAINRFGLDPRTVN